MFFKSSLIAFAFASFAFAFEPGYETGVKLKVLLQSDTTTLGQAIRYPQTGKPQLTVVQVEIPPGGETGWHIHPFPAYGYILSGRLTLEEEGGRTLQLDSGQVIVESVNKRHNRRNLGHTPVKIVAFYTGEAGIPIAQKAPK